MYENSMKTPSLCLLSALMTVMAFPSLASVVYVSLSSNDPLPPYSSWETAATNIQDAVDAATPGDLVLVTNGVYNTRGRTGAGTPAGGVTTNRVLLGKSITLQSCNGPSVTSIEGSHTGISEHYVRCVCFVTNNVFVTGFTLTN